MLAQTTSDDETSDIVYVSVSPSASEAPKLDKSYVVLVSSSVENDPSLIVGPSLIALIVIVIVASAVNEPSDT